MNEELEKARNDLNADENMPSQVIKSRYKKALKIARKNNRDSLVDLTHLRGSLTTLLEARKLMKSEKFIKRDAELHMQIRQRIKGKKLFAPKLWFKIALPLIIWAILQEIIMASTDIVDNIFVNWIPTQQVKGLAELQSYITQHFDIFTIDQLKAAGLPADYANMNYSAGQIAVNGVTGSNQLYTIMYCVVSGSCYGMGVYSAQFFGAGNTERLKNVTALKLYFTLSVVGLFMLIAIPGITKPLIEFTTTPKYAPTPTDAQAQDVMAQFKYIQYRAATLATTQGIKYFRIIFISYVLLATNETIITSLRETRRPIYSFIISIVSLATNCIMNVFLTAPKFLGSFIGLGVVGTAIATISSRILQFSVIVTIVLIKRFEFFPAWRSFSIKPRFAGRILGKASPIILNELLYAFGLVMVVKLKGMYSVEVLTANAMYSTMVAALFSPLYHGVNAGISVFVGNELGAGRYDIAEYNAKHLIGVSFIIGVIFGLLMMSISFVIPDILFSNANAVAKWNATWMMFSFGAIYPVYIITNGCYSILRTGGSMWSAFMMDAGLVWIGQIPLLATFILLYTHGILLLAFIIIHVISLLFYILQSTLAYIIYRRKTWLRNIASTAETVHVKLSSEEKQKIKADKKEKKMSNKEA